MNIQDIHFWYHPSTGGSGIQYLMEYYFGVKFRIYEKIFY
jgi:hypothetical protein